MRYRLGRHHADTIYRQLGDAPADEDERVAIFWSVDLAAIALRAFNFSAGAFDVDPPPFNLADVRLKPEDMPRSYNATEETTVMPRLDLHNRAARETIGKNLGTGLDAHSADG